MNCSTAKTVDWKIYDESLYQVQLLVIIVVVVWEVVVGRLIGGAYQVEDDGGHVHVAIDHVTGRLDVVSTGKR